MLRSRRSALPWHRLRSDKVPVLFATILIVLVIGSVTMLLSIKQIELVIVAIPFFLLLIWLCIYRRYEWVAAITLVVGLIIDWHQLISIRFPVYATGIALFACLFILLERMATRSLMVSLYWLLWGILLLLGLPPLLWAVVIPEGIIYYLQIFFTPMLIFVLGILVGRDVLSVRRMFVIVAAIGTAVAVHTIIAALTGTFLFATANTNAYLSSVNSFALGQDASRVGSFLRNPDWNGTFLAMMAFIPCGLFLTPCSRLAKLLFAGETIAILLALLFTYTTAAWLSLAVGIIPLLLLSARGTQRFWFAVMLLAVVGSFFLVLPHQSSAFLVHLNNSNDAQLRLGAWETAIRVILAYPFNGVGLGLTSYELRADFYRVPLQYITLAHPHNTYLELAALAGLPLLIAFLALLGFSLWQAFKNYLQVDASFKPLFGAALIAIFVFSFNCLTINGWTLPPLAMFSWFILAVIASPTLKHSFSPNDERLTDQAYP